MVAALLGDEASSKIKLPLWFRIFSNKTNWKTADENSRQELVEKLGTILAKENRIILLMNDKPTEVFINENHQLIVKELETSTYEY